IRRYPRSLSIVIFLLCPLLSGAAAQSPAVGTVALRAIVADDIVGSPAFSSEELSALPTVGWLKNGGNLFNQNYSPLKTINRETVAGLKGVWRTHLDGSGTKAEYSGEAQPVVYAGVIFIVTGTDDVFALSVKSGEILWKYQANL